MKELVHKATGRKATYRYRNLRMEKAIGFLRIASFETDDASGRMELMDRGHTAVVLPVDFTRREVYLIEQPRHVLAFVETEEGRALFGKAKQGGWTEADESIEVPHEAVAMLETPAGIVDAGETPGTAAVRELAEETGLIVEESALERIASYYPSAGGTAERVTAFIAHLPDTEGARHVAPLSKEDAESITVWKLGFDDIYALLDDQKVTGASSNILFREIRDRELKGENRALKDELAALRAS